ncbi:MAG: hypothetical protein ACTSRG_02475 [Candidatus Helarchaeota archaeon]
MTKKKTSIIILIAMLSSPFILLLNFNTFLNMDNLQFPIPENKQENPILKVETFHEITKNEANGTHNALQVNQTCNTNKTELDWTVQNAQLKVSGNYDSGVGPNEGEFNITVPTNYNRTYYEINVQNISAEATWIDIEQNTSSNWIGGSNGFDKDNVANYNTYGMSFNLTRDSRITSIAPYGLISVASGYYDVEIWNSSGGKPDTELCNFSLSSTPSYWMTFNQFNINLTAGTYFFVINASQLDGGPSAGVKWSSISDVGDPDDGKVYGYFIGADWAEVSFIDLSLKVQAVYIDSNNDSLININPEEIDMNMTVDSKVYDVNSTTYSFNFIDNDGKNESVLISANSSFSCNLTWSSINVNKTYTNIINYNITLGANWVNWTTNFSVSKPSASYGETLKNYSVLIEKPNPSWDMYLALNSSSLNVTKGIVETSTYVYLSNNTQDILTNGLWKFTYINPSQEILLRVNNSIAVTLYPSIAYIHGEHIQVNATIKDFSNGYINLTIYNSSNDDVTADWTTVDSASIGSSALFNLTVPDTATTGAYTIQTVWSNNTYAGINQTIITVINATEAILIHEDQVTGIQLLGQNINLTVYYNDTHNNAPITEANLTYQLYNESASHAFVKSANLTELGTPGYYQSIISTNDLVNGSFQLIINASKDLYNNVSITRNFNLVYNTSFTRIQPSDVTTTTFNPFNLTIAVRYKAWDTGDNLTNAIVKYDTNMTGQNGNLNWNSTDWTYYIQLNYTDYTMNNTYEIKINASKVGYLTQNMTIYWNLTEDVYDPNVVIDSPVNKLNTTASSENVVWSSSSDVGSGIKIFQVYRNGTSQYIGTATSQSINLLEGWNNITVVAQDYAGNNGSAMVWIIRDSNAPTISITNPTANGVNVTGNVIAVGGFANGTGTVITSVKINDTRFSLTTDPTGSLSGNYEFTNNSYIADGYIAVEVNVTDSASQTTSNQRWFYVDNTAPELLSRVPSSGTLIYEFGSTGNQISTTWKEWAPHKYNITRLDGPYLNATGNYYNNTAIVFNVDGLDIGSYTFRIGVNDTGGNSVTNDITVIVQDTTDPNLLYSNGTINYNYEEAGPINAAWRWNETHPDKYNITRGGTVLDSGVYTNNSVISIDVSGLTAGSYQYQCAVNDTSGNSVTSNITVNVGKFATTEVVLNVTGVRDILWGQWFLVNVTYRKQGGAVILQQGNATSNWTHPGFDEYIKYSQGNYTFNVSLDNVNNGPFTQAGFWGIQFTVNSSDYATASSALTVNMTTLTHLNATDQSWNDYNNTYTYQKENGTIVIFYNDTVFNNPLDTYTVKTNWTNGYWAQSLTAGYYNISLNTTGLAAGNYKVKINASSLYYQFKEIICNVTIKEKFNVTLVNLNSTIQPSYSAGAKINITIQILNGSNPVVGLLVNITINSTTPFSYQGTTDSNGIFSYTLYTISSEDVGRTLNLTVTFLEAYAYNLNSTSFIITVQAGGGGKGLFPPITGGGLDPIILFIVIGSVAVGAFAIVVVVGAKKRKERVEAEKKKTISSVTDVANIRHILVIHKGTGIDIFNYEVEKGLDPTLISGFIQAVKGFGKELSREVTDKKKTE